MREILFRGKRTDNEEWAVGLIVKDFECYGQKDEHTYIVTHEHPSSCFGSDIYIEVISETVGQYTGLTDKNGKKIFEGDICQIKGISYIDETPFVVEWNEEFSGWFWKNLDFGSATDTITAEIAETSIVIGNIHDNPELLKGEET